MYGAPVGINRVDLPPRPVYERPEIPSQTRERVKQVLAESLPSILDEFSGKKLTEISL